MTAQGTQRAARPFTGWHMTGILVAFFGVVMLVNFTMARFASSTFGGIVVENSYVASQHFNGWLEQAEAQKKLGWDVVTTWRPDGRLVVQVSRAPAGLTVRGDARHPLGRLPDHLLEFTAIGGGRYLSDGVLPAERWTLRLDITDGTHDWRRQETL
ncbi:conserved hypothetical protein [Altererythrobacter sp. B11]|uniref:FixH family protein n=1 Tax=Altererythrobacter sp. B11 TaxID=2060312 RepID=UPI000DC71EE0|nr:FixH family protein [Altererythrobacter sp. B11]BBC72358.1 conserved hypothetical protein [Altererythrobacter sp. B11]